MNTAVRAAVRLGLDQGHHMLGIEQQLPAGLVEGDIREFEWMEVDGWASAGGSELGTNRKTPQGADFYAIARTIEEQRDRRAAGHRRLGRLRRRPSI